MTELREALRRAIVSRSQLHGTAQESLWPNVPDAVLGTVIDALLDVLDQRAGLDAMIELPDGEIMRDFVPFADWLDGIRAELLGDAADARTVNGDAEPSRRAGTGKETFR